MAPFASIYSWPGNARVFKVNPSFHTFPLPLLTLADTRRRKPQRSRDLSPHLHLRHHQRRPILGRQVPPRQSAHTRNAHRAARLPGRIVRNRALRRRLGSSAWAAARFHADRARAHPAVDLPRRGRNLPPRTHGRGAEVGARRVQRRGGGLSPLLAEPNRSGSREPGREARMGRRDGEVELGGSERG